MTTTVDPIAAAEQWLAPVRLESSSVLFVIGFGEGHVLDVLDRRGWSGHVIALEPEASIAAECLNRKPVREWQKTGRLTILAGPDYIGLDKALAALPLSTEKPMIAGNPEVTRAYRDQSVQAARVISRAWFGARANDEAKRLNAGRYLLNTLRNAGAIAKEGDAASLKGLCRGLPALVVGAGPSLDRNLADISRYRDRVVILAADTALRPLLAAGIEPDVVVATDPTETNARHLCELPACSRTHLVAEGSVDSESLSEFEGRTFFFRVSDHHPWPWLRNKGLDRGPLRAWGSVLTTAFDLALVMGCEPVVFAGADLAFTDGRPYARGTTYEEVWHRAGMWGQSIEDCWSAGIAAWPETFEQGVNGETIRTAPHLRSFRDWIASEAGKATGRTIINGTGGGILLGTGIAQRSVGDVLAGFPILEGVAAHIADACHGSRVKHAVAPAGPDAETLATWHAFGGSEISHDTVLTALGRRTVYVPTTSVLAAEAIEEPSLLAGEVLLDCEAGTDLAAAIEAAWREMGPAKHRLVLRDRTGSVAGVSVRRALYAFMERHPDVTARHGRFFDPSDDMSWIDRRPVAELFPGRDLDKFTPHHQAVAGRLAPILVEHFKPMSLLDIGCGGGFWLRSFEALGVTEVRGVDDGDLSGFRPDRRFDLCLCLGVLHRLETKTAAAIVAACTQASDTVVFSVPAAAISVTGFINERSSNYWHALFLDHGFVAHDELRPIIEERWGQYLSSYDLLTVFRRVAKQGDDIPGPIRSALLGSTCRADDLVLQSLWQAAALAALEPKAGPRLPRVGYERLRIPVGRMESGGGEGIRVFRFRTGAVALAIAAGFEAPSVFDAGCPLRRLETVEQVVTGERGSFVVDADAVTFTAADGSDPRRNGRDYDVWMPAHAARLEQLPMATLWEQQS